MSTPVVFTPRSTADAVMLLNDYDGAAKPVAGGTAMTLMLGQKLVTPEALVSLRRLPGLREVELGRRDTVRLGALVSHAQAARHSLVRTRLPAVASAFSLVGNAQVRAAATVGGVLAEADYASDPPSAMLVYDTVVVAVGPGGERRIPLSEFFLGFYQTALAHDEIVTAVECGTPRAGPDTFTGAAYLKYTSRSHEDRPCVGVAALLTVDEEGRCAGLRVAVGAASATPLRLPEVEADAAGAVVEATLFQEIAERYAQRLDAVADVRGTAWYRREMVRVWVQRALRAASTTASAAVASGQGAHR